jgi:hypothetical protein
VTFIYSVHPWLSYTLTYRLRYVVFFALHGRMVLVSRIWRFLWYFVPLTAIFQIETVCVMRHKILIQFLRRVQLNTLISSCPYWLVSCPRGVILQLQFFIIVCAIDCHFPDTKDNHLIYQFSEYNFKVHSCLFFITHCIRSLDYRWPSLLIVSFHIFRLLWMFMSFYNFRFLRLFAPLTAIFGILKVIISYSTISKFIVLFFITHCIRSLDRR